jgi:hypothetical protein
MSCGAAGSTGAWRKPSVKIASAPPFPWRAHHGAEASPVTSSASEPRDAAASIRVLSHCC